MRKTSQPLKNRAPADLHESGAPTSGQAELDPVLDAHREALQTRFPIPPARAARRRRAAKQSVAAAALLAALGLLWWTDPVYRTEHYDTRIGQRTELKLADGSVMTLDTDTRLDVQWRLRSRRVDLQQGRAQFKVSPAIWRPFTIAAGDARIQVVGTRFDVWRKQNATEVSVYQGQVRVWREGQTQAAAALLRAGLRLSLAAHNAAPTSQPAPFDTEQGAAWQQGQLIFQDTPLAQAVQDIQRYYPRPIHLQAPLSAGLRISGVFDSGNIGQLLALLPRILPVSVSAQTDGSLRITPHHPDNS